MQYLGFILMDGWSNDRYLDFLRDYLKFLQASPTKRKYQKWLRMKKIFNRDAIDFFNLLIGAKIGRKIKFSEFGQELLEEIDKIKSDAELDYGPTMTEDGRRILAIDAETVNKARSQGENDFSGLLVDRFIELNGYLAKFVFTNLEDGYLAENELMKRIQSSIFHGARPNLTQLKVWVRWMQILGVMTLVGFRLKLTEQGMETYEYVKGIPDEELLDQDDDEDDEEEEEEYAPPPKKKKKKTVRAPEPEPEEEDDDDFDEFGEDLDEEGLDLPPEPDAIDHRGLDPNEEALLAKLSDGPAAVTGLSLTLSRPLEDLEELLGEINEAIDDAQDVGDDDEEDDFDAGPEAFPEPEPARPRRSAKKSKKKTKKKAAAPKRPRRESVALEPGAVAAAVADDEADVLPSTDELPIEAESEVEEAPAPPEPVEEPVFPNVFGKLKTILTDKSRPTVEQALAFTRGDHELEATAYIESPSPALLKNKARIMRWWKSFEGRSQVTAETLGLVESDDKYTLFFSLLFAAGVLGREATTKQKIAFFRLLNDSGALSAFYAGDKTLSEMLALCEQDKANAPLSDLFATLLYLPALKRLTDGGIFDFQHAKSARELAERLDSELVGKRLGPGIVWAVREGCTLGLWDPPGSALLSAVPDPVAIESAYRLGFVPTHYLSTTEGYLRAAEMLSRYFRDAEDGEAPLSWFARHQGCQFNCPWTMQCPYACREKDRRHRFA